MSVIPTVSEEAIRRWVGSRNLQRGHDYVWSGAIRRPRRRGMTLKGECQGSRSRPYSIQVVFSRDGRTAAQCTCPVGGSGQCKHVAALLVAWREQPELFEEVDDIDALLERHSKEDLILVVKEMLQRHPELELLVETDAHSE